MKEDETELLKIKIQNHLFAANWQLWQTDR